MVCWPVMVNSLVPFLWVWVATWCNFHALLNLGIGGCKFYLLNTTDNTIYGLLPMVSFSHTSIAIL